MRITRFLDLARPAWSSSLIRCSSSSAAAETRPSLPAVLDSDAIQRILPHRPPFLFVDRVIEYNPGVSAVGIKQVVGNEVFFTGHFPGRPIMPGTLIFEAMAQVGGIVLLKPGSQQNYLLTGIDQSRIRLPVTPGDTLEMRLKLLKLKCGKAKLEGEAYVGQSLVCSATFFAALV